MSDIPYPFNKITDLASARRSLPDAVRNALNFEFTNLESTMSSEIDLMKYVRKAIGVRSVTQVNVITSELISDVFRQAAPIVHQMYALSSHFLENSMNSIMASESCDELAKLYTKYLPERSKCTNADELELYRKACHEWRENLGTLLPDGMGTITEEVLTVFKLGRCGSEIVRMLEELSIEREECSTDSSVGANHWDEFIKAIRCHEPIFSFGIDTRRKAPLEGAGVFISGKFTERHGMGPLLLSTAILAGEEKGISVKKRLNDIIEGLSQIEDKSLYQIRLLDHLRLALEESSNIEKKSGKRGQWSSDIDLLFTSHFFVFKILSLSLGDVYNFQRALYELGRNVEGSRKSKDLLEKFDCFPGVRLMLNNTSRSTESDLPPWVINATRYYDLIAAFGFVDTKNFSRTILSPSVSCQYGLNLKSDQIYNIKLIVALFNIENMRKEPSEESVGKIIPQSKCILRQMLSSKKSPFVNMHSIEGNELNVKIIP